MDLGKMVSLLKQAFSARAKLASKKADWLPHAASAAKRIRRERIREIGRRQYLRETRAGYLRKRGVLVDLGGRA